MMLLGDVASWGGVSHQMILEDGGIEVACDLLERNLQKMMPDVCVSSTAPAENDQVAGNYIMALVRLLYRLSSGSIDIREALVDSGARDVLQKVRELPKEGSAGSDTTSATTVGGNDAVSCLAPRVVEQATTALRLLEVVHL